MNGGRRRIRNVMHSVAGWIAAHRRTAVASLLLVPALIAATFGFLPREQTASAIAAVLRDPMSVFADRSPGERPAGALTQTKQRLASTGRNRIVPGALPQERVLSLTRERPAGLPAGDPPALVVEDPGAVVDPGTVADTATGGSPVAPFALTSSVPAGAVAPIGGGGGGGGTTPTNPDPGTPVAPVPEPATWLMLIVGVAAIGMTLRRRGTRTTPLAATD